MKGCYNGNLLFFSDQAASEQFLTCLSCLKSFVNNCHSSGRTGAYTFYILSYAVATSGSYTFKLFLRFTITLNMILF